MRRCILLPCLFLAALAACAAAQGPTSLPAFDAVTVKPFVPHGPWHRTPQADPGRLYLEGSTPEEMILYAYGLDDNQVTACPSGRNARSISSPA